jgi:excisionase family DNA binding protein
MEKITFEQMPEAITLLLEKMTRIENLLTSGRADSLMVKEMLTTDEAAELMGISKSSLYKMTARKDLPTYKPGGKKVYLKRTEVVAWLASRRNCSTAEIEQQALDYVTNNLLKWKR